MHKLPVFATLGNALGFAFGNFFTVLRLAWLPLVAYLAGAIALGLVMQNAMMDEMLKSDPPDPRVMFRHFDDFAFLWAAMILLQLIALSAVAVAVHRVILFGDRKPGDYFAFAFGRTEFLFVVMALLSFLGVLVVMALILTPVVYVIANGDFAAFFAKFEDWPQNMPGLVQSGDISLLMSGYMVGWLVLLYFFLRLAVWPPTVVATGRLALGEAWALTRGNVLRILGLFILLVIAIWAIMVPFAIVVAAVGIPFAMEHADTLKDLTGPAAMREFPINLAPLTLVFWLVYLFIYAFLTGLTVALLSYSYKALKGYDAKAPIPQGG